MNKPNDKILLGTIGRPSNEDRLLTESESRLTLVQYINQHEIYLTDENGELLRRICGAQRANKAKGILCTQSAGSGTQHRGIGTCHKHDVAIANTNNQGLWDRLNQEADLPSSLMDLIDHTDNLEETHLSMVDDDIKLLYTLQVKLLENLPANDDGERVLSYKHAEGLTELTSKIIKAKQVRSKLKKELSLDASTVKTFVEQVFKTILTTIPENLAKILMAKILEEVITPFKTNGRITGDLSSIYNSPKNGVARKLKHYEEEE